MKLTLRTLLFIFVSTQFTHAQTKANSVATAQGLATALLKASEPFVFYAMPAQQAALRSQILRILPNVVPSRVVLAQGGEPGPPSGQPAVTVQPDRKDVPVDYIVLGATPKQEAVLRNQIFVMQPEVLPRRVIFAPHWKYLDDCRLFHVRNRAGSGFMYAMFTHLPSLTVFIDNDKYGNDRALGFWIAHELGHMKTNNADEDAAEMAAKVLRQRLNESARNRLQCCDATASMGSNKNAELPFQLLNDSLIVTQGGINSADKLNFVLDTGANCTLISSELVRSWNLQGKTESVTAMSGTSSTEIVTLSEIRIGPLIASHHRALLADFSTLSKQVGKPIAAIIGLDMLSSSNFMIDFSGRKLVFDPSKSGRHVAPFLATEPFPAISVNVEGQEMRLLVDSGTPYILMFRNRLDLARCKIEPVVTKTSPTITTSSGTVPATRFRAAHVSVGNGKLKKQIVLVAENPDLTGQIDGLLGLAQTGFQRVWFNFKDNTMAWE